jgi:hypothetical protein
MPAFTITGEPPRGAMCSNRGCSADAKWTVELDGWTQHLCYRHTPDARSSD